MELTDEKQALELLAQIPATIASNYDYFIDVGTALKSISDTFFEEWFNWAKNHCIIKFTKVFSTEPDLESGKLPVDPRFKEDPDFLRDRVCPALLNYLLDAFSRLVTEGINYKALSYAISEAQQSSSHLFEWANDVGLAPGKEQIKVSDLWESLKQWYIDNEMLEVTYTDKGNEKFTWLEESSRFDPLIKAPRLIKKALMKLFPKVKFSDRTENGYYVIGLSFIFSTTSSFFGSFGSGKEEKIEGIRVSGMNQTMNQMNQTPKSMNQIDREANLDPEPNEPNLNGHKSLKALLTENPVANEPKCPEKNNSKKSENISPKTPEIKPGDKVVIAKLLQALKVKPNMPFSQQTAVYTAQEVTESSAKCFAVSIGTYWFPLEWLGVLEHG